MWRRVWIWKRKLKRGFVYCLRWHDVDGHMWKDVDLDGGTVWVRNTPDDLTKSGRNCVLALVPEMCDLLRGIPRKGQFVFHTQDGTSWRNNVQRNFVPIVECAGIERCFLHDLRRTFVSQLAMAGVNAAVVEKVGGHASTGTTVKYYRRIMPEALRSAQAQLRFSGVLRDISDTYRAPDGRAKREAERVVSLCSSKY